MAPYFPHPPPLPRLKVSPNSLQYPAGYLGAVPERSTEPENGSIAEAMEYLTNILSTKVYDIAIESPLHLAKKLSERLGVQMFLKREDLQPVSFSFSSIPISLCFVGMFETFKGFKSVHVVDFC